MYLIEHIECMCNKVMHSLHPAVGVIENEVKGTQDLWYKDLDAI